MKRVPAHVRAVLEPIADAARRERHYRDASQYDDVGGHHPKGGIWNDREGRSAHGITRAEVAGARAELRRMGVRLSFDQVDALMMQLAERVPVLVTEGTIAPSSAAMRKARERSRKRAAGLCPTCPVYRANIPEPGRVYCAPCNEARLDRLARCESGGRGMLN